MKEYSVNILNLSEKDSFQDASKEELRVLLAIISAGGRFEDSDHLARLAKTSRARAAASLAFWEDAKVITEGKAEIAAETTVKAEYENDEIPEQSAKEVAKEIKDKGLASLLSECALLMGKPMLSSAETKKIVNVYSQYALNEEYIITLAAFLNEQNKLTAVRLANDAERLAKKGIDCVEELEIYIAKKARTTDSDWQYKHFFAIFDRPLSDDESERAERWFSTYGYSEEIVGLAYSITTKNKGKLEIAYRVTTRFVPLSSQRSISAGGLHTVAVRRNGCVIAIGDNTYGQCDTYNWRDITSVCAGNHHTLGLKSDGTVHACGYNGHGQCNVQNWTGVSAIAAGACHSVGLLANGACIAIGDNTYGQCNVYDWREVVYIAAGENYTVGIRHDGTIVATGANVGSSWGAHKWGSIVDVAAGGLHTVGLRSDGTCVAVGNNANYQCEISRWTNITEVAAGNFHTVGLVDNGQVIATGHNVYGQCNVYTWKNIVEISAGRTHTIALDRHGRVYAVGDNTYGQCDVQSFSDIKTTE